MAFLRRLAALCPAIGLAYCLSVGGTEAASKPNIVLVLADDMQVNLVDFMPRLKILAAQGITFDHALVQRPLCGPSRATLLTGRYVQNTHVVTNSHAQFYNAGNPARTIAVGLKKAGYRTSWIGKYINGYPSPASKTYIPPGWNNWLGRLAASNGADPYNYRLNENGVVVSYGQLTRDYAADVYFNKALRFIDRSSAANVPFFVAISVTAPHDPSTPAPRHASLFATAEAPKPVSFNETDVSDKPAFISSLLPFDRDEILATDEYYRQRIRSLQAVDEGLTKLVNKLVALNKLDQTYIFFMSDNGMLFGEHRIRPSKGGPHNESIRVPLIVRGPGVPPGTRLPHLVGNVDLALTFAELAGAAPPPDADGRSLVPLLRADPPDPSSWRRSFPLSFDATSSAPLFPSWIGVDTGDYVYARYVTGERELYDARTDPYQLRNLAGSAPTALVDALDKRAAALSVCRAAECGRLEDTSVLP